MNSKRTQSGNRPHSELELSIVVSPQRLEGTEYLR